LNSKVIIEFCDVRGNNDTMEVYAGDISRIALL